HVAIPILKYQWLGLVVAAVLAYSSSFSAGFALDNKALILDDARVHAATDENVALILGHSYWWPVGESGLYRPLTTLSYLFNYAILRNEDRPAGYHAVNLLLHIVNVLLVYGLIVRLLGPAEAGHDIQAPKGVRRRATVHARTPVVSGFSRTLAIGIAAVWAVHPLSTEAVTNIVGRADLLAAFGVLAGLVSYAHTREASGSRRLWWLLALAASPAVVVFSKEGSVAIAGVFALYEIVFRPAKAGHYVATGVVSGFSRTAPAAIAVTIPLLLWWQQRSAV